MAIDTSTPERIKLLWPTLTAEEKADLQTQGIVTTIIRTYVNLEADEDVYKGKFDVQARYKHVASGEIIGEDSFLTEYPPAKVVHKTLSAGLSFWPKAIEMLVIANSGTMPTIKPPKEEPQPVQEPIIVEEPEQPVDEPAEPTTPVQEEPVVEEPVEEPVEEEPAQPVEPSEPPTEPPVEEPVEPVEEPPTT